MKLRLNQLLFGAAIGCLFCAVPLSMGQSIGQWDFNSADLSATAGSNLGPLQYADGPGGATQGATLFNTTSNLAIAAINGTNAQVMSYPAETSTTIGYLMPLPSGGGFLNDYTMVMDVFYPASSVGKIRPLLQTDDGTADNILSYLYINANNALAATNTGAGAHTGSAGQIRSNTWYRIGFVVNHTAGKITFYTNGIQAGALSGLTSGDVYALPLGVPARLFSSLTETNGAGGYANSVQFRDAALSPGQMSALGGPSATGIPVVIPPVPSFIASRSPDLNAAGIGPQPAVHIVIDQGDTTIALGTIALALDGAAVPASVSGPTANQIAVDYTTTNIFDPLSLHSLTLVYQDSASGFQTNSWSFTIANYQNIFLPTPLYNEDFEEVAEGGLPTGWVATNSTDTLTAGLNLDDPLSDSYKNWVTIDAAHYITVSFGNASYTDTETYTSPGFPTVSGNRRLMIPPIVLNGVVLSNLASGHLIVAESDQRGGSQVQVLFTRDYDLTGRTNTYLSFYHLNEQNQDNICSVEYSINQGATWLPLLYMLDDGTTDSNGSDVVTNAGKIDVFATFSTVRSDQAHGLAFSNFIGAAVSTNLAGYIRPCRNDDPVQQKRIELFRLPAADGQANVRFRLMQAGTASWFFDIDNFAIYSINTPVITAQPQSLTVDAGTPATFSVGASGNPPLSYQWKYNGQTITGATNSTYTIGSVAPTNAGQYQVVVSNPDGPAKSSIANLTVVTTPQIATQPVGTVLDPGMSVTLAPVARGGRPLSYFWLLNGARLPGATSSNLTLTAVQPTNSGSYQLVATNTYGAVTSTPARVIVFYASITNGLVVHLPFDNDLNDSSGRGNNATYGMSGASANPSPVYTAGKIGQAFQFTTRKDASQIEYASLGHPAELLFGDFTDFTVSFWINYTNQGDDLPYISNKDWNSSNNRGWGIFSQNGGNFRVQGTGPTTADKQDTSSTPTVRDGTWHNIVVAEMRGAQVFIYLDGKLVRTQLFNTLNMDTPDLGYNVNIGQDGTGLYTDGGSAFLIGGMIDDLGIWRRPLTAGEAAAIYNAGLSGHDFTASIVRVGLTVQITGGQMQLTWPANLALKLQRSPNLVPGNWTDVPDTLGAGSATLPISSPSMFFRLAH